MKEIAIEVFGKLNLALNITGREKGMHLIESPTFHVDLSDFVRVQRTVFSEVSYSVTGITRGGVEKVLGLLADGGLGGFKVTVEKNLPVAGGMGGSSADVAALIAAVGKICDLDEKTMRDLAIQGGSDTPFMLTQAAGVLRGTGDEVQKLDPIAMTFVAMRRGKGVTSAQCYKKFDDLGRDGIVCDIAAVLGALQNADFRLADKMCRNALEEAATSLSAEIAQTMREAQRTGRTPHLTGSGNTVFCFASGKDDAQRLKYAIDDAFDPVILTSIDKPWEYK